MRNFYEKRDRIKSFDPKTFKGCESCPFKNRLSNGDGTSYHSTSKCELYGQISGSDYKGHGFDLRILKEDGTFRLRVCDITAENIKEKTKIILKEMTDTKIKELKKEIKELEEEI